MSCVVIYSNITFTPEEKIQFFQLSEAAISKCFLKKTMMLTEIPEENQYANAPGCVYFFLYAPPARKEDQKRTLIKELDDVVKEVAGHRVENARACVIFKHHHGSDAGVGGVMHLDNGVY